MKTIVQLPKQLNFFDAVKSKNNPILKLDHKQSVFICSLDVVLHGIINNFWICAEKDENPYYGYSIDFDGGSHTVVWDYDIGNTVFTDERKACDKAKEVEATLTKINPNNIDLKDIKSFEYYRKMDNYRLTATIAKVGDRQLYEHGFMCYHFLREYSDTKKRDKTYRELLKKISEEAEQSEACELNPPSLDTLYKVEKSLYASRGFAENKFKKRF